MRALVLTGLLGLGLAGPPGCATRPSFVAEHELHFVVRAAPPPPGPLELVCTCTAGAEEVRNRPVALAPGAATVEVAILSVVPGRHRIAVHEAKTGAGGRATVTVDADLWFVLDIGPDHKGGRLRILRAPPAGLVPRVPVPH